MYLNGKKIFLASNNKRTLPIVNGGGEEPVTRIYITIDETTAHEKEVFIFLESYQYPIDWGDGTIDHNGSHIYAEYGDYVITTQNALVNNNGPVFASYYDMSTRGQIVKKARFEFGGDKIGSHSFAYCKAMESVTLSGIEKEIPSQAFFDSNLYKGIKIPNSVTKIGDQAFYQCLFQSIKIPSSVKEIGYQAFYRNQLESVIFEEKSELETIGEGAFGSCNSLNTIELPEGLKIIGKDSFRNCHSLETITIPSSVVEIKSNAFRIAYVQHTSEKTITILTPHPPILENADAIPWWITRRIYIKHGTLSEYQNATYWGEHYNAYVELPV